MEIFLQKMLSLQCVVINFVYDLKQSNDFDGIVSICLAFANHKEKKHGRMFWQGTKRSRTET